MSRTLCIPALFLLWGGFGCSRDNDMPAALEPLAFSLVAGQVSDSGQWIEGMVAPPGRTVPTTFRIWLASPALASKKRDVVRAVMRRGDPDGAAWLVVMLGAAFYPAPTPPVSSGALTPTTFGEETDSLLLQLSVRSPATTAPWLAEARLANGGRFLIALDESTKRGEFRSVNRTGDMRVFTAIATLLVGPR